MEITRLLFQWIGNYLWERGGGEGSNLVTRICCRLHYLSWSGDCFTLKSRVSFFFFSQTKKQTRFNNGRNARTCIWKIYMKIRVTHFFSLSLFVSFSLKANIRNQRKRMYARFLSNTYIFVWQFFVRASRHHDNVIRYNCQNHLFNKINPITLSYTKASFGIKTFT